MDEEIFYPEPRVHEYLCNKNIIEGNPQIAPAIYLGNLIEEEINILFTITEAQKHCKRNCNKESCKEIIALFDKKRIQPEEQTLYGNR